MRTVSLEELLEAGCHFGHQVTRHNPKSRDFIFEARDNIHIIDLAKTKEGLEDAAAYVKSLASKGGSIIVVGTKRQARGIVAEEIKKAHSASSGQVQNEKAYEENPQLSAESRLFYVTSRWIGGILTNFSEINKNIKKLENITALLGNDDEKSKYTKKEIGLFEKERVKLKNLYGGIIDMKKSPDALFIIDTHLEDLAVREARRTGVKTVGIVDTNADPAIINYPIPANDDAVGSIKLIVSYIMDAWIEGIIQGEKNKKIATTEAQNENETLKPTKNKKTATTETQKSKPVKKKRASK